MKDWILDRWDARPKHLGRWVVSILAVPLLVGGGAVAHAVADPPHPTTVTSVSTEKIKGKIITVDGVKKVKLPPQVVTRNGHTVTLPGSTVALPGPTLTSVKTTTLNGTTFVTITKTTNVTGPTVTGPTTTVLTTVVTTVVGPGTTNTITETTTVTTPPPPPVTSTVTDTQTVTCTLGVDC